MSFSAALEELIAAPADSRRLGPYRCVELLDRAGTAPVFRAVEEHAGHAIREVAIKVFDVGKGARPNARVVDEARTLCRVQHPNVIHFITLISDARRGLMGLVMELAEGISLARQLETVAAPDRIALAVDVGIAVASALAAVHEEGIVHRNVKPSNVVLTDGRYKLINFGFAATLDSPETVGSDLQALGALLHQCILGSPPASPPATVALDAPPELAKLVDGLLAAGADGRPRSADEVRRRLERVRSQLAGRERDLPPEERGPFPGLDRYEAEDRDVFFGRAAEIAGLLELCRTRGLVGVVGLSGSGKSSLTRAGVVPAIEEGALGGWPAKYRSVLVTPGADLTAALEGALRELVGGELPERPEELASALSADVDAKGEGIVVLVDQLEEIVVKAGHSPESRRRGLELLSRIAEAATGLRVIVVVRRDVLDGVLAIDPRFARSLSRGMQLLGPLGPAAWEEVVDQGLEAFGYAFESPELRREVLDAVKDREAAMTLAQFELTRLWAGRDAERKTIPRSAFGGDGGMRGALDAHADAAIAGLSVARDEVRDILLQLTTPDGGRAHVELDELTRRFGAAAKDVVFALTKARLVASGREGFASVHDSVLRDWKQLRSWLDEARDDRLLFAHLERDAARWASSRDPAELWRKGRLAAAIEAWKRGSIAPSDDARAFLTKSANEAAKVRVAFGFLVSLVLLLVVGGSLIYAKESRERADQARRDAEALAAALTEVQALKRRAEEDAMEAADSAKLIQELEAKIAAQVQTTLKKVDSATTLEGARKAAEELRTPAQGSIVPLNLHGLANAGSGPALDVGGPSPSAGGGTFDQASIERVVNTRKAGVKRTCLERSASTASSTKVTAQLTIAPNGSVQGVSTTGDDPAVAKCIEQQLRTWSFPPPGETKQVSIPFVFVRQ